MCAVKAVVASVVKARCALSVVDVESRGVRERSARWCEIRGGG